MVIVFEVSMSKKQIVITYLSTQPDKSPFVEATRVTPRQAGQLRSLRDRVEETVLLLVSVLAEYSTMSATTASGHCKQNQGDNSHVVIVKPLPTVIVVRLNMGESKIIANDPVKKNQRSYNQLTHC